MRFAPTLLLIAGLGRGIYGKRRFQRVFPIVATVILLVIITAALMGVLVIGGFYAAYHLLASQGLTSQTIVLTIVLLALFVMAALFAAVGKGMKQIKTSVNTPAGEVVDAFLDGLLAK
jgi:hypothetical protein